MCHNLRMVRTSKPKTAAGARLMLSDIIKNQHGGSTSAAAAECGINAKVLSSIKTGMRRPGPGHIEALKDAFDIPAEAWER